MGDFDDDGNSGSFLARMVDGYPAKSDTVSLSPARTYHLEADLSLEEFKLLYKVLWAAQVKADSIAVMAILKDTDGISREVTMSTAEIMRAGHTFANVLRKFGLTPGAARAFVGEEGHGRSGEDRPGEGGGVEDPGGKGTGVSFRDLPAPSERPRSLAPPGPQIRPGEDVERLRQ